MNILGIDFEDWFHPDLVKKYLTNKFDDTRSILDVGCGHGFYYKLLKDHFKKFDAVEIWKPYIEEYKLEEIYDNVYNVNILEFDFDYYDVIILGDILEHIEESEGIALIEKLYTSS